MECFLATLLSCFSMSNVYIDTHLSYIDAKQYRQEWYETVMQHDWGTETTGQYVTRSSYMNPYGGLAVGFSLPFEDVTVSIEASHMLSSLQSSKDRGINAISLRARWFPFRN